MLPSLPKKGQRENKLFDANSFRFQILSQFQKLSKRCRQKQKQLNKANCHQARFLKSDT